MTCPTCGAEVPGGMSVCLECGAIVGSVQKATGQMYSENTAHRMEMERKNMLRGLSRPMGWLTKVMLAQVIVYTIQVISAIVLIGVLSNISCLMSSFGMHTIEFMDKLEKVVWWGNIALIGLTLVSLYLMGGTKKGYLIAGFFLAVNLALTILDKQENDRVIRLWMDLGGIVCEIAYGVFLFITMSSVAAPFSASVSEGWKRMLTWYILVYILLGILAYIMVYRVETIKGLQWCIAISGLLVVAMEAAIYKLTKNTYELL